MTVQKPKVGVGLLIIKGNKVLLGKRKNAHGGGEYASTGGHLEHNETIEEGVLRELAEEAGTDIKIENLRFLCITNLRKYMPKHYIDIGMVAKYQSGVPKVMEPNKKESWEWHDMDKLPTPLFGVIQNYVDAYKTGQTFFEN